MEFANSTKFFHGWTDVELENDKKRQIALQTYFGPDSGPESNVATKVFTRRSF